MAIVVADVFFSPQTINIYHCEKKIAKMLFAEKSQQLLRNPWLCILLDRLYKFLERKTQSNQFVLTQPPATIFKSRARPCSYLRNQCRPITNSQVHLVRWWFLCFYVKFGLVCFDRSFQLNKKCIKHFLNRHFRCLFGQFPIKILKINWKAHNVIWKRNFRIPNLLSDQKISGTYAFPPDFFQTIIRCTNWFFKCFTENKLSRIF